MPTVDLILNMLVNLAIGSMLEGPGCGQLVRLGQYFDKSRL